MNILTTLILLIITTSSSSSDSSFSRHASRKTLGLAREKQTHLHFYFHDIITAPPTRTAYPLNLDVVAKINSSTLFGMLVMADEPLTLEPSINSTLVGRAQGMYGSASLMDAAFFMVFNFAFSHDGVYNGSTLTLVGPIFPRVIVNELSIVGGTGLFRFARGYAVAKRIVLDFNALLVLNSTTVGRAHGMYGVASKTEIDFMMVLNFVFSEGEYRGSTFSLLGHNAIFAGGEREMPVVGGTGVFRFGRGHAHAETYSLDTSTGNTVVEYNVYVVHY
ncbi:Dirigent protein 3 [Linum perenne]